MNSLHLQNRCVGWISVAHPRGAKRQPDAAVDALASSLIHPTAVHEFGEMLNEMEVKGIWLFGLRTKRATLLPARDGACKALDMVVANFHIAYSDSDNIIMLDAKEK